MINPNDVPKLLTEEQAVDMNKMIKCPQCLGDGGTPYWSDEETCDVCEDVGEIELPTNPLDYVSLCVDIIMAKYENSDGGGDTGHDLAQEFARIIYTAKGLYK